MGHADRDWLLWPYLHHLADEATRERKVSKEVADAARRAAGVRFAHLGGERLDTTVRRRVAAYFWAVIRRRAVRKAPEYARDLVRASLTADLVEAGWERGSIHAELERCGLSS